MSFASPSLITTSPGIFCQVLTCKFNEVIIEFGLLFELYISYIIVFMADWRNEFRYKTNPAYLT